MLARHAHSRIGQAALERRTSELGMEHERREEDCPAEKDFQPIFPVQVDNSRTHNVITINPYHASEEEDMKAHVVRIGNSKGIRIPKSVIEQCQLHGAVDLIVQQGQLLVRSATKARAGWDQAFEQMHRHGDDQLMDRDAPSTTEWDRKNWTW